MPLFDSHSHYNLSPIWENWPAAVITAKSAGITGAVVVGTDPDTCLRARTLQKAQGDFFHASLGLHPDIVTAAWTEKNLLDSLSFFTTQAGDPAYTAFGEIGLDFFHLDRQNDTFLQIMRFQSELFRGQLLEAFKWSKPVILHVRDRCFALDQPDNAYGQVLATIRELDATRLTYIFHCFSGTPTYLERVLSLPHSYVSFAGNLTFKNAPELRALCPAVPPSRLLLETDCPFLSPVPKRGQPCQPAFLRHTAALAARELGVDLDLVYQTSRSIFPEIKI